MIEHHLMVGVTPYCGYLGCQAGQEIASKANVHTCGFASGADARRAAAQLRPFFCTPVRAVRGLCPTLTAVLGE